MANLHGQFQFFTQLANAMAHRETVPPGCPTTCASCRSFGGGGRASVLFMIVFGSFPEGVKQCGEALHVPEFTPGFGTWRDLVDVTKCVRA